LARENYYGAMRYYKILINADPLNAKALKGYGEAAIKYAAFDSALVAFRTLVDHGLTSPDGEPIMRLAEVYYQLGQYEEARALFRRYLFEEKPEKPSETLKLAAEKRLEDCEWAIASLKSPVVESALFAILDSNVNTREYSDHSPFLVGDVLYFSSNRFPFSKDKVYPKRTLNKVMTVKGDQLDQPAELTDFNDPLRHTTHTAFNGKGDVMYYALCDYVDNTYEIHCQLYRRKKQEDNTWGPAEALPDTINMSGYTTTQPSVGVVPGQPYEMLYFVSDRPGGRGGKDIWCAKIAGDQFSNPMNLTTLNTSGDDVTPFYHASTQTLYFSSDSLQTLGGFDIYKANWDGANWVNPVNLGVPINSGANDVYFMVVENGRTAFMATNRRGSFNQSEEGCCYDIYQVDFYKPKFVAITYLKKDGVKTDQILGYTSMTLLELGNPDAKPIRVEIGPDGKYNFDVLPGKTYRLIGEKNRYSSDTLEFTTPKRPWKEERVEKLYLEPSTPNLIVKVFDKNTLEPINGATAKFYDLGKKDPMGTFIPAIDPQPKTETHSNNNRFDYPLDHDHRYQVVGSKPGYTVDSTSIVSTEGMKGAETIEDSIFLERGLTFKAYTINRITNDTLYGVTYRLLELPAEKQIDQFINPIGKDYNTTLTYDKRYRIIATKDNFSTDSIDFTTANLPKVDFQTIVRELRLRPLDLVNYLPIPLYFDNDEPDKRTLAVTTKREYRATYVDYINRKSEFITHFTEGLLDQELKNATDSLEFFFETEVRGGWNRLMEFSEVLYEMLVRGDSIVITLKGYASPRAGTAYNKNLTDRRVSSVYNHFDIFDGGIYKRFVQSRQLIINREANGETKAPKGISDNIKDEKKSIYDVRASRERRLEIVGVKINKEKKL
ncbi:MAG: PD40 domain-containing protein, partial [Saprospiraceae bacterium]|nr:PD40 domain-containing protein [Saprospiraceae bacterium]